MTTAIHVSKLSKCFGHNPILQQIEVSFEAGKIHGIVGRNGSGKTVLMKCILGFLRPTEGWVSVFGKQIGRDCDFAPDTGMIIETPGFILTENGKNNLKWLLGVSKSSQTMQTMSPFQKQNDHISAVMRQVGLDPDSRKPVGKYSLGMRQRLGIAQAIMEQPRLLVLDEPMNGLDNQGVEDMRQLFLSLREAGTTILMASHNPLDITSLCDTVHEMDGGRLTSTPLASPL